MSSIVRPIYNNKLCEKLEKLIHEHHTLYLKLSNENLKPKHHNLLHYPRIMLKFGPLKHFATIRFEAKHRDVTTVAKNNRSRLNPAHSIALKIQLNQCSRFLAEDGFTDRLITAPKEMTKLTDLNDYTKFEIYLLDDKKDCSVYSSWVNMNGTIYKVNSLIKIKLVDQNLPYFYKIKYIIVDKFNHVFFLVLKFHTKKFIEHLQAFEIDERKEWDLIPHETLTDYKCYLSHWLENKLFVLND